MYFSPSKTCPTTTNRFAEFGLVHNENIEGDGSDEGSEEDEDCERNDEEDDNEDNRNIED